MAEIAEIENDNVASAKMMAMDYEIDDDMMMKYDQGGMFDDQSQNLYVGLLTALVISVMINIIIGCKCRKNCCSKRSNYKNVDPIRMDDDCQSDHDDVVRTVQ